MKKFFIIIILICITYTQGVMVFAQSQNQFFVQALPPIKTTVDFSAMYRITNRPSQPITFYAWIGQDGQPFSAWSRNKLLATIRSNSQLPFEFGVTFNFQDLGLISGVKYSYAIADRTSVNNAIFFNTPGSPIRECFTVDDGQVPCGNNQSQTPQPVPSQPPMGPNLPTQGPSQTPDPIPGPLTLSGLYATFPPGLQEIYETSAQLTAQISTTFKQDVFLTYTWAKTGDPLGNRTRLVLLAELLPGDFYNATMPFSDLEPNTSYTFAIRNEKTGIDYVRSFKTLDPNRTSTNPGNSIGIDPNSNSFVDPGGITAVEDTISYRGIVPRCGRTPGPGVPLEETRMCTYQDFLQLISNVIQYGIIIIGPIIALIAMYAGAMIIWLGKIPDKTSDEMRRLREMKATLVRAAIGIVIMLSSFAIVILVLRSLGVDPMYILIDIFS